MNKSAAKLTGRLTPPRHPLAALAVAETSTLLSLTHRPANRLTESLPPTKTRRGRAGVAAEPLCASPRFRPLSRFSFQPPMALIIENLCRACTRLIFYSPQVIFGKQSRLRREACANGAGSVQNPYVTKPCAKATMYQPMNVFQISPEIVPYSVSTS